ncbi:hypothetical protein [Francisella philomiragia]|uniref:hypothetical protein n=1 Tax=Francisella philomiragia TaxID=28110 RepID=UPI001C9DAC23|nr:hypothetical protein [Francisella philomiragia]MBY7734248.1 hypothetical protein [Francisella philomiragia]
MKKIIYILIVMFMFANVQAAVVFVNSLAAGKNTGQSWQDAYTSIQSALEVAKANDQIWVAEGTYYPTKDNNRDKSFIIPEKVTLLGGFKGDEKSINQRDFEKNKTILSGDILHNDIKETFSKHIVFLKDDAVIDGFTIENAYNIETSTNKSNHLTPTEIQNSSLEGTGAAIVNFKSTGVVNNCIIQNNTAEKGAGAYNMASGKTAVFNNVQFLKNYSTVRGGAMSNDLGTNVIILNSDFEENKCDDKGGAIYNDFFSNTTIVNTTFKKNEAENAATIGNDGGSEAILLNANITENIAKILGSALYQGSYNANIKDGSNTMVLINSTINNNVSLTNGTSIFTWGDDKYSFYNTKVKGWLNQSINNLPQQYDILTKLVSQNITTNTIKNVKQWMEKEFPLPKKENGKVSFKDENAKVNTNLNIPNNIYYVVQNNKSKKQLDGLSWDKAFNSIQRAIDAATKNGGGEIWVAEGIYYPDINKKSPRESSFKMKSNVAIYGGFSGDETSVSQRDFVKNKVILSGDIGKVLGKDIHSYHVIIGANKSLIDGVTITGGIADGQGSNRYGGGIQMIGFGQAMNVENCIFKNNYAYYGGAVYAFNNVYSYLNNVLFIDNTAIMGGGIYMSFGSNMSINNSSFVRNMVKSRGGSIVVNYGSNPTITDGVFASNYSNGTGGAIWVYDQASQFGGTSLNILSSKFIDNKSDYKSNQVEIVSGGVTYKGENNLVFSS